MAPFENMGRYFYSFLRKRAFGNPPLATWWPSPAPQAVGRKKIYRRSLPTPANGGQVGVVAEWLFLHNLALHSLPREGGPCFLKTCLPHLWGRGTTEWWKGGAIGGGLGRISLTGKNFMCRL